MTRHVPTPEQVAILGVLVEHPDGMGIARLADALASRLAKPLIRRTLQRRLDRLMAEQQIVPQGESVARVYKLASISAVTQSQGVVAETSVSLADQHVYVPLSVEGAQIRDQVRRPLMHRRPVGYNRAFLDAYEPGVTWYLPESLRAQLHEMGRTPADQCAAGTYARDILNRLLVDLSWASSRLEGNTYSRLDTQNLIEFGQVAKGKDARETQMILNHKAAIEMLVEDAAEVGCDAFTFQNLHAVLSQNLMREDAASGRLRRRPVEISGTVFYPLAMPQVLEDCFRLLLDKAKAIADPFE